ncbi:hypothetical protein XELAEV_18041556mg [Xenopus laevis]|uniref:Uncharacterized protein n=1 Tax=Xenopus laevis TaxID=8355 RepID=A0A974C329_XENLA|nr:hypothetical protein XELAEV_18041556mg [Xenopus laevis]
MNKLPCSDWQFLFKVTTLGLNQATLLFYLTFLHHANVITGSCPVCQTHCVTKNNAFVVTSSPCFHVRLSRHKALFISRLISAGNKNNRWTRL